MRRDDEPIRDVFEKSFFPASEEQMETGCERVWQRLRSLPNVESGRDAPEAPTAAGTWGAPILVPVMALTALLLVVLPLIRGVIWPENLYARVLDGSVERLNGGKTLRTNSGRGALVALSDASRIEMRTESELSLEPAADGIRIRLEKGNVIVEAARGKDHLHLQTKDVTVTAVGTVFLVDAAANGSLVAVIDGEARLDCGSVEQTLRPGQRIATTPGMPPLDMDQEVAWSRTAKLRLAMLKRSWSGAFVTGGSVTGVVRASAGRPVPNVPLVALRADTITKIRAVLSLTETDADGRYRLENVPPGSFYIIAGRLAAPTYYPGTLEIKDAQIVSVPAGGSVTGMDFVVQDASTEVPSTPILPAQPSFEVASVKQNNHSEVRPALRYTPSGVDFAAVPLTWIIGEAYQLPYYSPTAISATDPAVRELLSPLSRYDVSARAGSATSRSVIRLMLQSLLADRFKLALHHESKEEPVYKLAVGKNGRKFRDSADQSEVGQPVISNTAGVYDFRHVDMARLAGFLSSLMDRPVVDATGLSGFYDFSLKQEQDPQEQVPQDKSSTMRNRISSSSFAGMESQAGLKLEAARAPIDHVVIDHLEKPSEN